MNETLLILLFIIAAGGFFYQLRKRHLEREEHEIDLHKADEKFNYMLSQKKSSEVRTGQIAEKLAPLLEEFPEDAREEDIVSLGMPIDYIVFGKKYIDFIEVKSGNSKLSTKQRKIRDQIQAGLVRWKVVRIK